MVPMVPIFWVLLFCFGGFSHGLGKNVSTRPASVQIGALFTVNSTIGRVAKIAIEEAVKDVNSDSTVLYGTRLDLTIQNSKCSGFTGMVEAMHFMETDIVAVIGPQSSVVAHIISHVANELRIPLLSFAATDPTLSSLQFPYFVRTTHSDLHQMAAAAEIVDHYGWKEVIAIFVDDDYGRNGVSALDDKLAERRCRISYKAGISPGATARPDLMDILVKVALMESRIIVLHVYPDIGFTVFSVARYLGMMGNGYVWIATDWLSSVLDSAPPPSPETMESMQGVLVLRQHTPDSERKRKFFSRWNKLTGGSLGLHPYGLYAYDTVWLLAHALDAFFEQGGRISFSNDSKIPSLGYSSLHLEAMSIFNDGILLLRNILQTDIVGLTGAIKFNSDRTLRRPVYDIINVVGTGIRSVGYWSNKSGLSTVPPEKLQSMTPNASSALKQLHSVIWPGETLSKPRGWVFPNNGRLLKIGVPKRVGFREFVSQMQDTGMVQGFCIDVFTAAVNLLPYAVPYEFVPFGNGRKNPSYDELVHKTVTGEFDAVVGDIAITRNRTKIVDFTQPFASSGLVIVAPFKKLHSGPWSFLQPFTRTMWVVTGAFFLLVGIVVWILEHRINDEFRGPPRQQVITILWFSFSTWFFAHRENTLSALGRIVLIVWLFVVLIINSSYTASLTSILTVQQLYSPIKGIDSLKEHNDPIGFQVGSFAEYYLSEELNISRHRLVPLGSPEQYAWALKLGPKKKGGVAAIVDERPYIDIFLSTQCTFKVVGQEFTRSGWGFAFPRDSPLAVDLSTAILALAENGDLQRVYDKWLVRSSCILDNGEVESNQLHISSFYGVYLVCGIACGLALLLYFLKVLRELCSTTPGDSVSRSSGSSRSGHLKRFLTLLDEKADHTKREEKRRKIGKSFSENDRDEEFGRNVSGKQKVAFQDDINPSN